MKLKYILWLILKMFIYKGFQNDYNFMKLNETSNIIYDICISLINQTAIQDTEFGNYFMEVVY